MKASKKLLTVFAGLGLALFAGCAAEDGLRDGFTDGLASAVAALIEAPVIAWIDATF
ncbi:MAG TPA: hypothetical protein PL151_08030 [Phycisphaerae bacterium]|nr:hypothetical protein [Phycisphaerae bacterium]HOJ74499.1 hypothetical protein [Phycisphaerae bacterium]HOM53261.1 hypothetical protein [Phycisphaerae bacterium]HON68410.1 hypothetical protein [Phycisphaerae bacterium]HOQ87054.1 hypothetical protein [Phycisphaerae bacterium]